MSELALPQLSAEEIRVLGSLVEKSKTTPDYYPLTLNALVTACNQKSSRNPVVEYDEETVIATLDSLKKKQLIAHVIGTGSRALKYRHTLSVAFSLDPAELSVLCLLFLRGPLTPGEVKANAGRLYDFDDLAEVQSTLEQLFSAETPFIQLLPRRSGQKEQRYWHCFGHDEWQDSEQPSAGNDTALSERVFALEEEVRMLRERLDALGL